SSPYWLTYKQAAELGGNVIKGQKGTEIIFYKTWEKKNEQGEDEKIPMLRSFVVFNLDQIENIEKPVIAVKEDRPKNDEFEILPHVENAILATGAVINHVGVRAFYAPSQ
ncbi:DNA primase, partial [Photobacterium iliopiscarium]